MIQKLRIKFILIYMSLVVVILGTIFALLYFFTANSLKKETIQMMENISYSQGHLDPLGLVNNDVRLPFFSILVNDYGISIEMSGSIFDLSDEDLLRDLWQRANDSPTDSGLLKDYNLRFLRSQSPFGQIIVYVDMSSEKATLRNLVKTLSLVGGIALVFFLAISILLSYWAVSPVEKAWTQQKQFVSDASHELKTPLTVITTDSELMQSPDCSEEDRIRLSGSILSMSKQMRGLVESLLELARVDRKENHMDMELFSLSDVINDTLLSFEPLLFENGFSFSYQVEEGITMRGSSYHIKELVSIFLDNAGKYASPNGKIILSLNKNNNKRCLLTVANEGPPILPEDLPLLFERFYRADKSRSMNHSYGLGLSIAQTIVQSHGGKIWAESQNGINSFLAELPLRL